MPLIAYPFRLIEWYILALILHWQYFRDGLITRTHFRANLLLFNAATHLRHYKDKPHLHLVKNTNAFGIFRSLSFYSFFVPIAHNSALSPGMLEMLNGKVKYLLQ